MADGRGGLGLEAGRLAGADAGRLAGPLVGRLAGAPPDVRTMGQPCRSLLSRSGAIVSGQPKVLERKSIPPQ